MDALRHLPSPIDLFSVLLNTMTEAVAVFNTRLVKGEVVFTQKKSGVEIQATFTQLNGLHGFHIHKAGDLRGEGCKKACDHYHVGPPQNHGGPPAPGKKQRHTGDLGNVTEGKYVFTLKDCLIADLFGRSIIVHADEDDYGLGGKEDSLTTGHSGKRIACAVIGRCGE
jgi:Cu-Zn family superoxide dismutase